MIDSIVENIQNAGGSVYKVGGCVRDEIRGCDSKDIDLEVFGIQAEQLVQLLQQIGNCQLVGESFGVVKLGNFDISLPRRERKIGEGHTGFLVESDPNMSVEEALSRRDFTMNAIMVPLVSTNDRVLEGGYTDPFNGIRDLQNGILRPVSERFKEDPLRILRGMQFASRFNMRPDNSLKEYGRELKEEFHTLSPERIWGEFEKWSRGLYPHQGIELLKECGWLECFPDLFLSNSVETILRKMEGGKVDPIVRLAALLKDSDAERFLIKMRAPNIVIRKVASLVKHLDRFLANQIPIRRSNIRRLTLSLGEANIHEFIDLLKLIKYNSATRILKTFTLIESEEKVKNFKVQPVVLGRDLLQLGVEAGPNMGSILSYLFERQLSGCFTTHEEGLELAKELI